MLQLSTAWFQQTLEQLPRTGRFWIALSGGLDSRVLLELCARLQLVNSDYRFCAIHVNHQLQTNAVKWAQFCTVTCAELDIDCIVETVDAQPVKGKSPEQAARDARRAAFSQSMCADDVLLTAHHLNDQAETVLLRLFRGSGITGLAGIRPCVEFNDGWIARPLLEVSRKQLQQFADLHSLQWVDDPSNQCLDFDRNYLRQTIIPQLEQRWPGLQSTLARNAHTCLESDIVLSDIAKQTLTKIVTNEGSLLISELMAVEDAMQNLVLREWFTSQQLKMPSSKMLQRIKKEVIYARIDRMPCLKWVNEGEQHQIRRYRDQLFVLQDQQSFANTTQIQWDGVSSLCLPADLGCLSVVKSLTGGIAEQLWEQSEITIRFRSGGETCLLPGRRGHRSLKSIFQEAGIPPWERDRIPLVYLDDQLAAIGILSICEPFYVNPEQPAVILQHLS
jgi:tRNA(Ile)-lysidine synthase